MADEQVAQQLPRELDVAGGPLTAARRDEAGTRLWFYVKGEIDLQNAPALRGEALRLIEAHKPEKVILNLESVPYMDSSAIAVLVEILKAVRSHHGDGATVALTHLQPRVKGLLQIARLDTLFAMPETDAEVI